jgi:membrane protease subunit (stomatin/prohibitin family)
MGIFKKDDNDSKLGAQTFQWEEGAKGENVMYRMPRNIRINDNVIVKEDEYALFFRDGKVLKVFDRPGRFALTTQNVPLLSDILEKVAGVRQLGEIYYVQRRELRGKFGTKEPIAFRDTDFGIVRIRVFGQFSYKVIDPTLFISQFAGTKGVSASSEVIEWARDQIVMSLNDVMGELKRDKNMAVIDMPAYLEEMEQIILSRTKDDMARYGLEILKMTGLNINLPDKIQEAIDKRGELQALGVNYMQYQAGQAMEKAAENPGGAGQMASMGVGLGAGLGMGQGMTSAVSEGMQPGQPLGQPPQTAAPPPPPDSPKCPKCNDPYEPGAKFCNNCGEKLLDTVACIKCGKELEKGSKFCADCGSKQTLECPKCNAEIKPGAKFCNGCGEKLE